MGGDPTGTSRRTRQGDRTGPLWSGLRRAGDAAGSGAAQSPRSRPHPLDRPFRSLRCSRSEGDHHRLGPARRSRRAGDRRRGWDQFPGSRPQHPGARKGSLRGPSDRGGGGGDAPDRPRGRRSDPGGIRDTAAGAVAGTRHGGRRSPTSRRPLHLRPRIPARAGFQHCRPPCHRPRRSRRRLGRRPR